MLTFPCAVVQCCVQLMELMQTELSSASEAARSDQGAYGEGGFALVLSQFDMQNIDILTYERLYRQMRDMLPSTSRPRQTDDLDALIDDLRQSVPTTRRETTQLCSGCGSARCGCVASGGRLALEMDLGPCFHFHSSLICAVSREQASDENPPKLLKCGHVICS